MLQLSRRASFCLLLTLLLAGCPGETPRGGPAGGPAGGASTKKPTVAFVPNGVAPFWTIAIAGAKQAGQDLDVNVEIRSPENLPDQRRMLEELVAKGVDGIAVSPIDGEAMQDILNVCAENTKLITQDSDAPKSKRLAYVGTSNYDGGWMAGELVREAIPDGGEVMIFIGRLEQENAALRTKGTIDAILGRPKDPAGKFTAPEAPITEGKYTVLGVRTDKFSFNDAKAQAEDTLAKYPDIDCMVGLFTYNPPAIFEALKGAGKFGQIKVVAFDEEDRTLQAIVDGQCAGTIVQNPFEYGYHSVKILAGLARGDESVLPPNKYKEFPARRITKDNVWQFWAELKQRMGD